MIPVETLREVGVIFTHKNCPDGMATAMILKDAFRMLGMAPRIEFLAHNTPEHRGAIERHYLHSQNTRALFCDIAPHPDVYRDHVIAGDIVLDHHKGVEELVRSFGALGVFADEKLEPGVSGATLAWREVWAPIHESTSGGRPLELVHHEFTNTMNFARDVGARDTWQTEGPRFQRGQWISKYLMSKPAGFWLGTDGYDTPGRHPPYLNDEEIQRGRCLFESHEEAVRQAVGQLVGFDVGDDINKGDGRREPIRLVVFQEQATGFRLCSDLAELLRGQNSTYQYEPSISQIDVVAGFSYVINKPGDGPTLLYSLRGLNGFDVAAFAKANGGGGHTAAAGFSIDARPKGAILTTDPYEEVRRRLETFLC